MNAVDIGSYVGRVAEAAGARECELSSLQDPFRLPPLQSSFLRADVLDYREACSRYLEPLDKHLRERLASTGFVREVVDYQLQTGGKRMRAVLPVWVCCNLGGDARDAFDFAIALELLHNASVVQDDIEDGDTHRRGKPCVWHRYGSAHAINVSSALIFESLVALARGSRDAKVLEGIGLDLLRLIEGQSMDLRLLDGSEPPSLGTWVRMARSKTGMFFAACMRAGLAAARLDPLHSALTAACVDYAIDVGLTFQVQDDLLDLVGDKGRDRRASDLIEGKVSFPIAWALANADPNTIQPIRALLALTRSQRSVALADQALRALEQAGALRATADWLRRAVQAAAIHPVTKMLPGWLDAVLAPVADYVAASSCAVAS